KRRSRRDCQCASCSRSPGRNVRALLKVKSARPTRSTCHHDCGAGAFEFGQLAAPRHLHLELAAAAADDGTVWIRRIQRVDEPPPPSAPAAAGSAIAAD